MSITVRCKRTCMNYSPRLLPSQRTLTAVTEGNRCEAEPRSPGRGEHPARGPSLRGTGPVSKNQTVMSLTFCRSYCQNDLLFLICLLTFSFHTTEVSGQFDSSDLEVIFSSHHLGFKDFSLF